MKDYRKFLNKQLDLKGTICGNFHWTEWLRDVFEMAIRQQVSDIHFEPFDVSLIIRFRVNGVLQEKLHIKKPYSNNLIRCIKILANLDIALHRSVQEGRFTMKLNDVDTNFRVAIVPTPHGESIVIRILDNRILSSIIDNYLKDKEVKCLFEAIKQSHNGLTLICGPTGSGKTSFMYALLSYLYCADLKIITVEDPVEYAVNGITQLQVDFKRNIDFPKALKFVLRHDPDVIMIGEIRDAPTAKIAIQASLTGHLVLATVHASDSIMAIGRLKDLDIEPYLIAETCRYIIAQRLVPVVCSFCFREELKVVKSDSICSHCDGLGYKGRRPIRETLHIDEKIAEMIHEDASLEQLKNEMERKGKITLKMQAEEFFLKKIIDITTFKTLGIE